MRTRTKHPTWIMVLVSGTIAAVAWLGMAQPTSGTGQAARLQSMPFSQSGRVPAPAGVAGFRVRPDTQVFYADLVIRSGDRYVGDVAVYSGDVRMEAGGTIVGSLYVFNGNVSQEAGAEIGGDLLLYSGNAVIAGTVGGALQCLSGNIDLQDPARIGGDVSVLGGEIRRGAGVYIGGKVLSGPRLALPSLPGLPYGQEPTLPTPPSPETQGHGRGPVPIDSVGRAWGDRFLHFVVALLQAALVTMAITLLAGMLVLLRQETITSVATTMGDQPVLSFAIGIGVNSLTALPVGLLALTWLAWPISLCLTPFSLPVGLLALGLQGVGWTATGLFLGRRLAQGLGVRWAPPAATVVGVIALTAGTSLLWLFDTFLGVVVAMLIGATGVGALLVHWRNSGRLARSRQVDGPQSSGSAQDMEGGDDGETRELQTPTRAHAAAPSAAAVEAQEVDFTRIRGIDAVFDARLKAANIRTLTALALLSPQELAEILAVSVERIEGDDLLEQARRMVAQGEE